MEISVDEVIQMGSESLIRHYRNALEEIHGNAILGKTTSDETRTNVCRFETQIRKLIDEALNARYENAARARRESAKKQGGMTHG